MPSNVPQALPEPARWVDVCRGCGGRVISPTADGLLVCAGCSPASAGAYVTAGIEIETAKAQGGVTSTRTQALRVAAEKGILGPRRLYLRARLRLRRLVWLQVELQLEQ